MNAIFTLLENHAEMLRSATTTTEKKEHIEAIYQLCTCVGGQVQPEDYIKGAGLLRRKLLMAGA